MAERASILEWLTKCPAHDVNFAWALGEADRPTLQAAADILREATGKKTAFMKVHGRLRRLQKEDADKEGCAPEGPGSA